MGGPRPAARPRAAAPRRGRRRRRDRRRSPRRWPTSSTRPSTRPAPLDEPGRRHAARLRRAAPARRGPSRRPRPPTRPIFRTMDAVHDALEVELDADDRVFVAGIDVGDGRQRLRPHPRAPRPVRRPGPRHADLRDGDHGPRRRRGDGRDAPGGRAHVPRLRRRVPRPAAQPGGQAAVHDRRRGRDGADRAHPVRRRALVGQPALAEPRGAARPHPRPDRGDAVDAGRHLRPAPRRDPGPEPGDLHREPAALRHEGAAAAGRPHRPDRHVGGRAPGHRRHRRVGLADGPRGARRGRGRSPPRASRSR